MNSDDVRRRWKERSGEFSPEYYAYRGPDETSEAIRVLCDRYLDRDGAILELGCSSGRHLAHLHENGFRDLSGVEVNGDAVGVMEATYPSLADASTVYVAAIENVLEEFDDGRFDAVYSVETLQHIHPDNEWVFEEIVRITDTLLITVENEGQKHSEGDETIDGRGGQKRVNYVDEGVPLYYRNWFDVFAELGCAEIETWSGTRDTLRAFSP